MFNSYKLNDKVTLKNKIVMAPMTTWASNDDLTIADDELKYYIDRSKEVGMVITGCTFFQKNGQGFVNEFYAGSDDYIPSLKRLAEGIKAGGAKAVLQIFHAGRLANPIVTDLVSASAVRANFRRVSKAKNMRQPRALTHEEVLEFIEGFYQTVRRAIEAGFDGIEIHGANAFLIQQFFSPHANVREDEFGGSLEKRMRLPLELVNVSLKAKKEFANDDFIIGFRISPEEFEAPGITLDDSLKLIDKMCNEDIDYIHLSISNYTGLSIKDKNVSVAKEMLKVMAGRKPLIGVGAVKDRSDVEKALNEIGYDMIAVGNALVTDKNWLSKIEKNEPYIDYVDMNNLEEQSIPVKMANAITSDEGWFKVKK